MIIHQEVITIEITTITLMITPLVLTNKVVAMVEGIVGIQEIFKDQIKIFNQ